MQASMLQPADKTILVDVVARTDALFSPMRVWKPSFKLIEGSACNIAIIERRRAFPDAGVPFIAGGTVNQRKELERQLGALQSWGYLRLYGGNGRRTGVRLTDLGDDTIRALVCMPLYFQAWRDCLSRIKMLIDHDVCILFDEPFVCEDDICAPAYGDCIGGGTALADLEDHLFPLRARNMINEHIKTTAHVFYALKPAGIEALKTEPPEPDDMPDFDEELCDRYHALRNEYLAQRLTWTPNRKNEVFIPGMAGGQWPEKTWQQLPPELQENRFRRFAEEVMREGKP